MKKKFLNLAVVVFTVTALPSISVGDPAASQKFPRHLYKPSSALHTKPVMNDSCKADSCCRGTTVADGIGGGRAAETTFKRVVSWAKSCSIEGKEQRSACLKGMRA